MNMPPFRLRLATTNDKEEILKHLRNIFYQDEPLCSFLQVVEPNDQTSVESEECSVDCIKEGISIVAIDESSSIIGVCLNELKKRSNTKIDLACTNTKIKKIFNLLECIEIESNVFRKYPNVNEIVCVNILSVLSSWRGKGVAQALINETRRMAKNNNVPLLQMDCTSYYSAQLAEKMNFHCIYKKKYTDYLEDGKPVLLPSFPHNEVRVYIHHV